MKNITRNINTIKIFLVATIVSGFIPVVHSQNVKVELSEQYEEPKNSTVFDVVGYDESGIFLSRYQRRGLFSIQLEMEKYGHKLNFLGIRDYETVIKGEDLFYSNGVYFNGHLYALGNVLFKKEDKREVYYQELDKKSMSAIGKPVFIQSFDEERKEISYGSATISPNDKSIAFFGLAGYIDRKALMYGTTSFINNKDEVSVSVVVFDKDMNQSWNTNIDLPYLEKLYDPKNALVDDEGNFYILGRLFKDGVKEKKRGLPNYEYLITAFREGGKDRSEFHISLDDNFITDCSFAISPDNKIICSGFYSEHNSSDVKGTFYMVIDPETKKVITKSKKEFDAEFLKLFMSDNRAEKGAELSNFDLNDIVVRDDGGAVLVGEQYYVETHSYYDEASKTWRETREYHFNDIIVININPDKSIAWATRIPKKQSASSGYYLSYALHIKGDKIYLVFNDNEKNLDEKNPDKIYAYDGKQSIATLATINNDGSWSKSALFSNKEEGVIMRPIVSEQINEDELIIYAERGKKYVIGKITFE